MKRAMNFFETWLEWGEFVFFFFFFFKGGTKCHRSTNSTHAWLTLCTQNSTNATHENQQKFVGLITFWLVGRGDRLAWISSTKLQFIKTSFFFGFWRIRQRIWNMIEFGPHLERLKSLQSAILRHPIDR